MSDLIDRQQAIEAICMETCGVSLKNVRCRVHCTEVQTVEKLPPAQPEIIRCKDCRYFKQVFAPNDNDGLCGHWHSKCDARTNRNGYCSHAERREKTE